MNISQQLAVVVPSTGHHVSVAPTTGHPTEVASLSWSNYLGGAALLVLLVTMLRVSLSSAGFTKKQTTGYRRHLNSSARSVHHH
ncbi:MAG: hypothetical protein JOZ78_07205 [Chroococcidiopsidaceae cyanobacterium CP_BM_ER_R8_30]|nr:hypothetical protein [Chroococcidiopsidaceae cyanobacterium CP_BM_ER_R8_30]